MIDRYFDGYFRYKSITSQKCHLGANVGEFVIGEVSDVDVTSAFHRRKSTRVSPLGEEELEAWISKKKK